MNPPRTTLRAPSPHPAPRPSWIHETSRYDIRDDEFAADTWWDDYARRMGPEHGGGFQSVTEDARG